MAASDPGSFSKALPPTPTPSPIHPLEVHRLAASYGTLQVLKDVNLTVRSQEVRVILGGSGCGKSTLLKHLVGLMKPIQGSVRLLGIDWAQAEEPLREKTLGRIGMLFQSGALLNGLTLLENVALPLRERTQAPGETVLPETLIQDVAAMKLALVGLEHAAERTPPELSGGMKKRAALARAMALDPEILFCDEPSAGLDPATAAELDRLILNLRDQFHMTLVVVTHELASIHTIADQVLMLDRGQVVADGPLKTVCESEHPSVRAFFDRTAQADTPQRPSVWDTLKTTPTFPSSPSHPETPHPKESP